MTSLRKTFAFYYEKLEPKLEETASLVVSTKLAIVSMLPSLSGLLATRLGSPLGSLS